MTTRVAVVGLRGVELRRDFGQCLRAQRIAEVRSMQREPHDALLRPVDNDVLQRAIHVR